MKRFFCSICKKVKRVRNLPTILENQYSDSPDKRIGSCDFHSKPKIFKVLNPSEPLRAPIPFPVSVASKGRKGKR